MYPDFTQDLLTVRAGLYSGLTQLLLQRSVERRPCSELPPGLLLEILTLSLLSLRSLSPSRQNLLQTYSQESLLWPCSAHPLALFAALLLLPPYSRLPLLLLSACAAWPLLRGYSAVPNPRSSPPPSSTLPLRKAWARLVLLRGCSGLTQRLLQHRLAPRQARAGGTQALQCLLRGY